jgi:outer membrane protein
MNKSRNQKLIALIIVAGFVALGIVVGMVVAPVRAQSMYNSMGYVDIQKALDEHPKRQSVYDQMQTFEKAKMEELPSLDTANATKAQIADYLKKQNDILDEVQKERERLFAPLIDDVDNMTKAVGKEAGIEMILDAKSVLYGGIDLTPEVIRRLKEGTN